MFLGRIGIWKCWFLRRAENRRTRRKTSRNKGENQQQAQPTYGINTRIRTRATLIGGRRVFSPLHHPPSPFLYLKPEKDTPFVRSVQVWAIIRELKQQRRRRLQKRSLYGGQATARLLPFKTKALPKNAKSALPVDERRSSLLVCLSQSIFKPGTSTESRLFSTLGSGFAQKFRASCLYHSKDT